MSDLDKEELEATRNMGKTADETENEIEKIIQFMIEDNYNISFISSIRNLMALYKTYLSLYNKEKTTSHYIQSQLDIANAKLIEEKEMNAVQRKMLNDAFDRGWIHKDKVRERIRELKISRDENADEIKRNMKFYSIYDSYNLQINELYDLLLEEWLNE